MTNKNIKQLVAVVQRGEGTDKRNHWTKVGVAFPNRDVSYNLRFNFIPTRMHETTIQLRDFNVKEE